VSQVLKLAELAENDGMTEMKVGTAGVASELDVERRAGPEGIRDFLLEVFDADDFRGAPGDEVELFVERWEQFLCLPC
jgi:hypothetical protein